VNKFAQLKKACIFVPTITLKHNTMTKQKVTHISRTIKFKKSPNKGNYFMDYKVLDLLIDKFIKETKCKFIDFDLVNDKKIVLMGVIK